VNQPSNKAWPIEGMNIMQTYTQAEFDAFPIVNGYTLCPTGDYSAIVEFPARSAIGDYSFIGYGSFIGEHSEIGAGCIIGERCIIGDGSTIGYGCTIGGDCTIGGRFTIGQGTTIGK
jgi:UDP-3-O-[3-hydroxymyristoyl] glucosamine N-acyltransferase